MNPLFFTFYSCQTKISQKVIEAQEKLHSLEELIQSLEIDDDKETAIVSVLQNIIDKASILINKLTLNQPPLQIYQNYDSMSNLQHKLNKLNRNFT